MFVSAIIAAGGRGVRLGADRPKQFVDLGHGKTMIDLSVAALRACPLVNEVIVAVPAAMLPGMQAQAEAGAFRAVEGGDRRQDSVERAFAAISPAADIVIIHDAARPFVSADLVERTIHAARAHGAAVAAIPATDTVKQSTPADETGGRVVRATLPRETIFLAQTPQAFQRDILAQALAAGADQNVTDEAT